MKSQQQLGLYCLLGALACGLAVVGKLAVVWGIDTYLYSLPVVGGVLASLEVTEVASPILLALLGLALGALTYYLPGNVNLGVKLILLGVTLPLVLCVGYAVRHAGWVRQVATEESVSMPQAQAMTDAFLQRETEKTGRAGYYWYTATNPLPPTRLSNLENANDINSLQAQLTAVGKRQTGLLGLAFSLYSWLFTHAGWGMRAVYGLLSGFMGLFYFFKGQLWAQRRRRP